MDDTSTEDTENVVTDSAIGNNDNTQIVFPFVASIYKPIVDIVFIIQLMYRK